ncbi:hypothetical protein JCM11251_003214 [Rhodosporidiobolus azoricus]
MPRGLTHDSVAHLSALVPDPLQAAAVSSDPPTSKPTSLDRSPLSSPSNSTLGSNPFREASLDFGPSSLRSPNGTNTLASLSPASSASTGPTSRPGLPNRPSELARELAAAAEEDLPTSAVTPPEMSRAASGSKSPGGGWFSQLRDEFRTGSGWFAPVIPPEAPLTREERAALEKERIDKLKQGRQSKSSRRPGLLQRMSSGVELFGPGGMGSLSGGK